MSYLLTRFFDQKPRVWQMVFTEKFEGPWNDEIILVHYTTKRMKKSGTLAFPYQEVWNRRTFMEGYIHHLKFLHLTPYHKGKGILSLNARYFRLSKDGKTLFQDEGCTCAFGNFSSKTTAFSKIRQLMWKTPQNKKVKSKTLKKIEQIRGMGKLP